MDLACLVPLALGCEHEQEVALLLSLLLVGEEVQAEVPVRETIEENGIALGASFAFETRLGLVVAIA